MIKVGYVYTTPHFSGAAVSMAEVLSILSNIVEPEIFSPKGSAADYFLRKLGCRIFTVGPLTQFDHTRFGRYRGIRWLVAMREVLLLPTTWWAAKRFAAASNEVDILHLNEVTGIVVAVALKRRMKVPLIVHIRAHMGNQTTGLRSQMLWWLFDSYVDAVICIDETVRTTLPRHVARRAIVIHNGLDIATSAEFPYSETSHKRHGLTVVGIVGSLLRVKGVYEFVEAAKALAKQRSDVVFILYGAGVRELRGIRKLLFSSLRLADDVEGDLRRAIGSSGLQDRIILAGHRSDLSEVYREIDILCFPSHYNAPGRPIFEAAYFGKPSIVAIENPLADTLIDGSTGIAIPAKNANALADAIAYLLDNQTARLDMGTAARQLATRNFDVKANASLLLQLYSKTLEKCRPA